MYKIFASGLPSTAVAIAFVVGVVSTSEAAWPRYRVTAGYSLPTAPYQRPNWVPVYPPSPYLPNAPVTPVIPSTPAPGYYGNVPAANTQPSLYAPPPAVPNTTYYPPPFSTPGYNQPVYNSVPYNPQPYNPTPTTSFYSPQVPVAQPYQQPLPIPNAYNQPMQPAGGFYQPTRPSTFYSPVPSYYPQPSTFGRY